MRYVFLLLSEPYQKNTEFRFPEKRGNKTWKAGNRGQINSSYEKLSSTDYTVVLKTSCKWNDSVSLVSSRRDPHIFNDKNISARFFTIARNNRRVSFRQDGKRKGDGLRAKIKIQERIESFNKMVYLESFIQLLEQMQENMIRDKEKQYYFTDTNVYEN